VTAISNAMGPATERGDTWKAIGCGEREFHQRLFARHAKIDDHNVRSPGQLKKALSGHTEGVKSWAARR